MNINSKEDLKKILKYEEKIYFGDVPQLFKRALLKDHDYQIWQYQKALRKLEYHYNNHHIIMYRIWARRTNKLGGILGIQIRHNTIQMGLHIWHYGSIIINGNAKIGMNCQLHGNNCIGNKGEKSDKAPVIGNNVDIGVGAVIIGDVFIANNVRIGANAVVIKSCYEEGAILVGNPARMIDREK